MIGDMNILLGVVYLPPPGDFCFFEEHHSDLFMEYSHIVVLGDFNCNLFDLQKSAYVRSTCFRLNLSLIHNSKSTRLDVSSGSTSLIDFVLVSSSSLVYLSDQVFCPIISDHALIFASLNIKVSKFFELVEYRDYRNVNWDDILAYLSGFDYDMFNVVDLDAKCSLLSSLVMKLFEFVPVVRKRISSGDNWIKSNCITLACSIRDLAFRVYLSDKSRENWKIFCKCRNKAKSVVRREHRQFYYWPFLRSSGCIGEYFDINVVISPFIDNNYAGVNWIRCWVLL